MDNNSSEATKNNPVENTADTTKEGVNAQKNDKTFTQDEVNEMIRQRVNEVNAKSDKRVDEAVKTALAEQARQSKLSDEQRADEALKKRNEAIEKRERDVTLRERRSEAMTTLIEREIPTELVDYVVDLDADKTAENIDKLTGTWNKCLENAVKSKLAGATPKDRSTTTGSTATSNAKNVLPTYSKNGTRAF